MVDDHDGYKCNLCNTKNVKCCKISTKISLGGCMLLAYSSHTGLSASS